MDVDLSRWSGEGAFTQTLIDALRQFEEILAIRVEDAPSSRTEAGYAFIANEVYLSFRTRVRKEPGRLARLITGGRLVAEKTMTLATVEAALSSLDGIGPPDYVDASMLQYLRTERIVPPYQRKGIKQIEMVRIYEAGSGPRPGPGLSFGAGSADT